MEKSSFCSCIFVRAPGVTETSCEMTVLIYDEGKKTNAWAYPGGNPIFIPELDRFETPMETARRKLFLETGLTARILKPLLVLTKRTHDWHLFEAPLDNLDGLHQRGDKGQYISRFPIPQLLHMHAFLMPHKEATRELNIRG